MNTSRLLVSGIFAAISIGIPSRAGADPIMFNDGTPGAPIGAFYSALGVTFTEGSWGGPYPSNQSGTPSTGLVLVSTSPVGWNPPFSPTEQVAISAFFSMPVTMVSLLAVDVGMNGVRLVAYDAPVGGSIVRSDSFVGSGAGVGTFPTLLVTGTNIRRFEVFLLTQVQGDGQFFDNLDFSAAPTPEPASIVLFCAGLAGLFARARRKPERRFREL